MAMLVLGECTMYNYVDRAGEDMGMGVWEYGDVSSSS